MRIIATTPLIEFAKIDPDVAGPLRGWIAYVAQAKWRTPADVKADFGNASIIGNARIIFNIKGNDYRLIAAISYRAQIALIKFVGTHSEYDRIDAETVGLGD